MIINEIRKELRKHVDQKYHDKIKVFFKEGIKLYGIKTPIVKKISLKYFSSIKMKSKQEIFSLCEKLLKSGYSEERTIAFDWAFRLKNRYEKKD
ncbi:DNA alkylation repair protein, partial [candidate division WOR-3 bacterium]|nr:DNA alkylation repair protein [candidate division WOR-3 bacterium]